MNQLKDNFLNQLQVISKMKMMQALAPFIQGEDALMLKLYLEDITTPKDLSKTLNVTKGRITAILNSLKKKNYIRTENDSLDRRYYHVKLTDEGYKYIDEKLKKLDLYFNDLFLFIGQKDAHDLVDVLNRLLPKIEKFEA